LLGNTNVTSPNERESYDLVIVGAGIVGAACAEEAARRGLRTLILERGTIGSGSTAAGMGHVVVMDDSEAQFALTSYSRQLWNRMAASLPSNVQFDPCGTIWAAADEEEMAAVEQKFNFYRQRGVSCEIVDAATLRHYEPNLRDGMVGGLRVPDDSVLYPPCAAAHLLALARENGATVREHVNVVRMNDDGSVTLADGTSIRAATCVNATGCSAPDLSPALPVRKRKGHLVITDRYPGYVRHQVIELGYLKSAHTLDKDSVAFNIQPRKNGQMLIGSSRQFDANDSNVEFNI
jgi:glycine/D-amino acid oxidase-like deaminating enzyme